MLSIGYGKKIIFIYNIYTPWRVQLINFRVWNLVLSLVREFGLLGVKSQYLKTHRTWGGGLATCGPQQMLSARWHARLEDLTAMTMINIVFWNVTMTFKGLRFFPHSPYSYQSIQSPIPKTPYISSSAYPEHGGSTFFRNVTDYNQDDNLRVLWPDEWLLVCPRRLSSVCFAVRKASCVWKA